MSDTQAIPTSPEGAEDLKAAIRETIEETDKLLQQIKKHNADINASRSRTKAILNQLKADGLC